MGKTYTVLKTTLVTYLFFYKNMIPKKSPLSYFLKKTPVTIHCTIQNSVDNMENICNNT